MNASRDPLPNPNATNVATGEVETCPECEANVYAPTGRCPMCNHPIRPVDPDAPSVAPMAPSMSPLRKPILIALIAAMLVIVVLSLN
ncbi:MAG: hypothetical protein ACYTGQ_04600 [Planctomycetota bacterium]|jgi:hypothetical protein